MATPFTAVDEIDAARREVQKILASPEFAPSRQLRDFLLYVSEAAFEGRTHLEQIEIAEKVLKRGKEFSPLDDASVRKLGTTLRQRLQRYYDTDGVGDPVRVTLPVRSYVPTFEVRPKERAAETAVVPAPLAAPARPTRRELVAGGSAAVLAAAGAGWWLLGRNREAQPSFIIQTQQGDIMHGVNNVAGDSILLGPAMGWADEVVVRLLFTPERATQQAGILIFGDADRYVKLGRQFLARPQLEFGMETGGRYVKPPGTFAYDPDAQTGEPVWLMIRRHGTEFRAYVSDTGSHWKPFGNVLTMPEAMTDARAAIFAHNGRSNAPSAPAQFDRLGIGLSFHNRPVGPADLTQFAGWKLTGQAGIAPQALFDGECLVLDSSTDDATRGADFVMQAPKGDWTVSTRLDFLSVSGSTAGLTAWGPKGRFRLIRWDLDGGSISAEHLGLRQFNVKDAEGAPPVTLRLLCRGGVLSCAFSRDDRHFQGLPMTVPVRELSDGDFHIGLHVSTSSWKPGDARLPARFHYFRQELGQLKPLASAPVKR